MTPNPEEGGVDPQRQPGQSGSNGLTPIESLPADIQEYIKRLRVESETNRKEATSTAEQLEAARQAEKARLEEQGNYAELAKQRAAEVEALKPYQERASELEKVIRAGNEALIQRLPEDKRGIVPADYPPEKLRAWLDTNLPLLLKQPAPDFDAGAGNGGGGGNQTPKLTDDEKAIAASFGMTEEQWVKAKAKMGPPNT